MFTLIPQTLFHYTSIKNLALILKSRRIRFSRLINDYTDDQTEGKPSDLPIIGKYHFISCWTELRDENIPFWKMYTENMHGVRIELPSNPFSYYLVTDDKIDVYNHSNWSSRKDDGSIPLYIKELLYEKEYNLLHPVFTQPREMLFKINYVNKINDMTNDVLIENPEIIGFRANSIGKQKLKMWQFQEEWRYRIEFFLSSDLFFGIMTESGPIRFYEYLKGKTLAERTEISMNPDILKKTVKFPNRDYIRKTYDEFAPSQTEVYLDIDYVAFTTMKIVLGPNCDNAEKSIVESLISTHNPSASLEMSKLRGLVR